MAIFACCSPYLHPGESFGNQVPTRLSEAIPIQFEPIADIDFKTYVP